MFVDQLELVLKMQEAQRNGSTELKKETVRHLVNAILKRPLPEIRLLSRRDLHHDSVMLIDGK